jgi:peptidoglycan/LPS O-acetylase OafA/YrhL
MRDIMPSWLFVFCPGIFVALMGTRAAAGTAVQRAFRTVVRPAVVVPLGAGLAALTWWATWQPNSMVHETRRVALDLFFGLLLAVAVTQPLHRLRLVRLLAPVGVVSYGIYLWHWIVKLLIERYQPGVRVMGPGAGAWLRDIALLAILTAPLAVASWFLVERPSMRAAAAWVLRSRDVRRGAAAALQPAPLAD